MLSAYFFANFIIYSSTVTPIERAVPFTMLFAASISEQFKSGIFVFAISSTCALVSLPTLSLLGRALAVSMPSAFLIRTGVGGVLRMKVKLLS